MKFNAEGNYPSAKKERQQRKNVFVFL